MRPAGAPPSSLDAQACYPWQLATRATSHASDTPHESSGLLYVGTDRASGRRRGRGFSYHHADGTIIRDPAVIARIKTWPSAGLVGRLDLPSPDGHLQATGRDARGRK
jgi:DNA topoisomerase IB